MNLTETEILALPSILNLCDGHAHRSWSAAEAAVVARTPDLLAASDRRRQKEIESTFVSTFLELARQSAPRPEDGTTFYFTASQAIEVIANLFRITGRSAALIDPCFDNLGDILRRHGIYMEPVPESVLSDPSTACEALDRLTTDAVFLVSPNNPTGFTLSEDVVDAIANHCANTGRLVVVDSCFRFYTPQEKVFDLYAVLRASGADYLVLEDTGKTWPTLELKAPFLVASPALAGEVARIRSDFLLHVSPFTLRFVHEFIRTSLADGLHHVRGVVADNRAMLEKYLANTYLTVADSGELSLAWLRLPAGRSARVLTAELAERGVEVLSGERFCWSDPEAGDGYIRVALVRDAEVFEAAAAIIADVCGVDE
jgi:aspartate/methionine/tyrosine aminotransferase